MLPTAIDLSDCVRSTAVVNGLVTPVYTPRNDRVADALYSSADETLLDWWVTQVHKDLNSPDPDTACWVWGGPLNAKGYGAVTATRSIVDHGFQVSAHVLAWTIEYGTVPRWALIEGRLERVVLHHECCELDASCMGGDGCLHRRCSNPGHLALTTNGENTRRGKGRQGEKAAYIAAQAAMRLGLAS